MSAPGTVTVLGNAHTTELSQAAWKWVSRAIDAQASGDMLGAVAAFRMASAVEPAEPTVPSCVVMLTDLLTDEPDLVFGERRAFAARFCDPLTATAPPHSNDPDPDRPLKIGYVSADFRGHSAAYSTLPAILHHDRRQFETHLYLTGQAVDQVSSLFRRATPHWHPVKELSEEQLAERIRADGIDVLVDLAGYSQGHRIGTFARRPAPVQILGWGATSMGTGIAAMDYVISDDICCPPGDEDYYHEKPLRLPCVLAYAPPPLIPSLAPSPVVANGYVTFGNYGRPTKVTEEALRAWARILRAVPDSRLALKNGEYADARLQRRVLNALVAMGVGPERVSFGYMTPMYEHQERLGLVDIALDTWPENGGATVLDALLMGVPVVTQLGRLSTGRAASSLVKVAGLADPIVGTDAYVERAVSWASDPAWLAETRRTLRRQFLASPICDGPAYSRAFEARVREVWQLWCGTQRRLGAGFHATGDPVPLDVSPRAGAGLGLAVAAEPRADQHRHDQQHGQEDVSERNGLVNHEEVSHVAVS